MVHGAGAHQIPIPGERQQLIINVAWAGAVEKRLTQAFDPQAGELLALAEAFGPVEAPSVCGIQPEYGQVRPVR